MAIPTKVCPVTIYETKNLLKRNAYEFSHLDLELSMEFACHVYILTNDYNTVLYTGVTSDLYHRIIEHRDKVYPGFTSKYNVHKLVYYEEFEDISEAIAREKQIKAGSRQKKLDLVNKMNPKWEDLWKKKYKYFVE